MGITMSANAAGVEPEEVRIWKAPVVIPTYEPQPPDKNPLFFRSRVIQGSDGNLYPGKMRDCLSDTKVDKTYTGLYLENKFIKLMILPEHGGKVQYIYDKTNNYKVVYHNRVIKPALIGTMGTWESGGIEFNFPQHHRPTTSLPVDYCLEVNEDGSRTIWVGETERLYGLKANAGITLHPNSSVVEVKVRIHNPTALRQTFLWWANVAVHVDDNYQLFFPEDVNYGVFHHKRYVLEYPIAKSFYSKPFTRNDFTKGVDVSWVKNIPLGTSYFAEPSSVANFFGGYDHGKKAGIVHYGNRHLNKGRKLGTWGWHKQSDVWEKNLTDEDGRYAELMAGFYTDNQPDFSWIQPGETKVFSQFFYPIREIGPPELANKTAAASVDLKGQAVEIGLNTTEAFDHARVVLNAGTKMLLDQEIDISPDQPFHASLPAPAGTTRKDICLSLYSSDGQELITYRTYQGEPTPLPEPYKAPLPPREMDSVEDLYLAGVHLDQNHHGSFKSTDYYEEALRRDPGDMRVNLAYGRLLLKRGNFSEAEQKFRRSIETATRRNFNPESGAPYYYLGLTLQYQNRIQDAYDAYYKSIWDEACKAAGYYAIAQLDCLAADFETALEHVEQALVYNTMNNNAWTLKAAILRKLNRPDDAERAVAIVLSQGPLDFDARYERYLIARQRGGDGKQISDELRSLMRGVADSYLDVAIRKAKAGFRNEALAILAMYDEIGDYPMVAYYQGYLNQQLGDERTALRYYDRAAGMNPDYCFPNRLESIEVLKSAQRLNPADALAPYYLGNLLYDKKQYAKAIECWERSRSLDPGFATVHRNMGQAYNEIENDLKKSMASYAVAFELNPHDARVLLEFDRIKAKIGVAPTQRLAFLESHRKTVEKRDDLFSALVGLHYRLGDFDQALTLIDTRVFHPWEGGSDSIWKFYEGSLLGKGAACLNKGECEQALQYCASAMKKPANIRIRNTSEYPHYPLAEIHYWIGVCHEALGNTQEAKQYFIKAATERTDKMEPLYYTGLALRKLGEEKQASDCFSKLVQYGKQVRTQPATTNYFASFEADMSQKMEVEGYYLQGLGHLGHGQNGEAREAFGKVLDLDITHSKAFHQLKSM